MTHEEVAIALREMEIAPEEYDELSDPAPLSVMEERLEKFKAKLKRRYRKVARRLHPDTETGSAERFLLVKSVYELIQKMEIEAKPKKVKIRIRL